MPTVGWRERILFYPIQLLFATNGNSGRIQLQIAERKNRSVVEATREMLEEKSMPKFYWAEAICIAVYIQNRIRDKVSTHELYLERNLAINLMSKSYVKNGKQRKYNRNCTHCALFKKDWPRHVTQDTVNVDKYQTFLTFHLYFVKLIVWSP